MRRWRHWLGALLVIVGFLVLVVDVPSDATVISLTGSHGVDRSDLIGAAALLAGVITLW
ncbi:MAG: hypothetical protein ACJ74R_11340 [Gaiellaceae bacterium]